MVLTVISWDAFHFIIENQCLVYQATIKAVANQLMYHVCFWQLGRMGLSLLQKYNPDSISNHLVNALPLQVHCVFMSISISFFMS